MASALRKVASAAEGHGRSPAPSEAPALPHFSPPSAPTFADVLEGLKERLPAKTLPQLGEAVNVLWIFAAVTAVYLVVEVLLLHRLMDAVSDPSTTPRAAEDLRLLLKLSAGFGLCWLVGKKVFTWAALPMPAVTKPLAFAGFVVGAFGILTVAFDLIIEEGISDEAKARSMVVAAARTAILKGELEIGGLPKDDAAVMLGMGAAVLDAGTWGLEAPVADLKARMGEAIDRRIEEGWEPYRRANDKVRDAFAAYRKAVRDNLYHPPGWAAREREAMERELGGLSQDIRTVEEFLEYGLAKSTSKRAEEARAKLDEVLFRTPDGRAYRGWDIPRLMDRDQYMAWAAAEKGKLAAALAIPSVEAVKAHRDEFDRAAGAVILPPISALLSVVSILLNVGALLGLVARIGTRDGKAARFAAALFPSVVLCLGYLAADADGFAGTLLDGGNLLALKALALAGML